MRITDSILKNNLLYNLGTSTERLYESETEVLTGKTLNKPSDGPVDVLNSLSIRKTISELEQYQRNISKAQTVLQNTETIVSQVEELFERLNVLAVQGASDSYSASDKASISYEVNQLLEQLYSFSNSQSSGLYIFSGQAPKQRRILPSEMTAVKLLKLKLQGLRVILIY